MTKLNPSLPVYAVIYMLAILTAFSGVFLEPILGSLSGSVDEILFLVLLLLLLLLSMGSLRVHKDLLTSFLFILILIVCSLVWGWNKNPTTVVLQSIISFKFFLFFYAFLHLKSYRFSRLIFNSILFISVLGILLELYFPGLLTASTKERFLGGVGRVGGLQKSPNSLATVLVLAYLLLVYNIFSLPNSIQKLKWLILLVIIIGVVLTGSRTALLVILSSYLIKVFFSLKNTLSRAFLLLFTLAILTGVLFALSKTFLISSISTNLSGVSEDSGYIRGMMLYHGAEISISNFPFGTGAATFGTPLSGGSKVYEIIGISKTSFVVNEHGIYDSNLASILGEFGFIGLTMILFLSVKLLLTCYALTNNKGFTVSMGVFIFLLFITTPLFMNSYFALIFAIAISSIPREAVLKHPLLKV